MTHTGVSVVETDGSAMPAIVGAPTSVTAFVGLAERGPLDRPVRVSSPAQFREQFGAHHPTGVLAYALEGFFHNGGTTAWLVRVAGGGSTPASAALPDRSLQNPGTALRLLAGRCGHPTRFGAADRAGSGGPVPAGRRGDRRAGRGRARRRALDGPPLVDAVPAGTPVSTPEFRLTVRRQTSSGGSCWCLRPP